LRVETGITGSQGNTSFYGPLYPTATPWGTGFYLGRYGNDNLKWEETKTDNIGINVGILENRIQFEADYYIKNTDNLLLTAPLPDYLGTNGEGGIQPPTINIGSLENRGWAFSVNTVNYDRQGITWNTNFNISGFKTKVTKFYSDNAFVDRTPWFVGDFGSGNNWTQRSAVGYAPWLFQGYIYEGIFTTVEEVENSARPADNNKNPLPVSPNSIWVGDIKYKDMPTVDTDGDGIPDAGDGIIDERDKTNIGNPWPKFTFGLTNNFSYKGFELSVLVTGVYGNDVYNWLRFNNTNPNNINIGRNLLKETFDYARIEGEGSEAHVVNPGTDIPRISSNNTNGNRLRITDQYVEDGSYIRIKNIQLAYSVPRSFISKQNVVQGLRVAVAVQNAATFTKYKGYDPEVGAYVGRDASGDNQSLGLDYGRYPLTPVYSFTVGVDF
jgi:TonB-dependent starch-binding outer membrane protein SusC